MKIIDLLNKIANGEEVPDRIKYENKDYYWCNQCKIYERLEDGSIDLYNDLDNLNDEVEILDDEKDKDIPLIPDDDLYIINKKNGISEVNGTKYGTDKETALNYNFKVLKEKINILTREFNEYRKENDK